ncbi:MAG: DNA-directed RNA polymerase subunit beta', partial [Rhodospirillaceae bacterium]|nr:DNA-directed RNA polymerase subunit beta' [Rhodospirillaceae bacterium]
SVVDSSGIEIIMGRNCEIILKDKRGSERARHRLPYGAKLFVKDGQKVEKGQSLATWDPFTLPLISEKTGKIQFIDMIESLSFRETMDEQTGVSNMVVVDWRQQPKGGDLKPRLALTDAAGELMTLSNGREAHYFLSVDAILNVENGDTVHAGDVLARIPKESTKTRDITGGLPRVAELFEARKPKDHAIISDIDGRVEFGKDYKSKRRIIVVPEGDEEPAEHLIPKGKHISVHEGDFVRRGDPLMDGNAAPHDILRVLGVEALAVYLIQEIQEVYRLQGVKINDKHIEVICRQMMQKVEITDPGETTFLIGEQVDRTEYDEINERAEKDGHAQAKSIPILQGITKASLQTRSFVSAASFQETTRVLTEAAVAGKSDDLIGLKENVIVGRLIPAGTGSVVARINREAAQRALDQQMEMAEEELAGETGALAPPEESAPAPAE